MAQILLCKIEEKTVGVEAQYVRETVELQHLSMLPGTVNILSGVMNLRGRAIPVVNLSRLFGRAVTSYEMSLVLEHEATILALPIAEVIGYQQYEGTLGGSDIFNTTEIAYEDVEVLSIPNLVNLLTSRLQFI